jgi:hypothetical protein
LLFGITQFAGGAPGLVGVDQVNVLLPPASLEGCAVPLQISATSVVSQPVTVSTHSGGGQCVDPPIGSAGVLVLKRSVVLNDSTVPESDTLTAAFTASPGQTSAVLPFGTDLTPISNVGDYQGPSCPIPGYTSLDPGVITVKGPDGREVEARSAVAGSLGLSVGMPYYQAALPAGFMQPGVFRISSPGFGGVGPFQATLQVGSGIQVTSQFPQGPLMMGPNPFVVRWTGGQPGMAVVLRVITHGFPENRMYNVSAPATQGIVRFQDGHVPAPMDMEIDVLTGPDPDQPPQTIAVPGLTGGLQVRWLYEYRFIGLH